MTAENATKTLLQYLPQQQPRCHKCIMRKTWFIYIQQTCTASCMPSLHAVLGVKPIRSHVDPSCCCCRNSHARCQRTICTSNCVFDVLKMMDEQACGDLTCICHDHEWCTFGGQQELMQDKAMQAQRTKATLHEKLKGCTSQHAT